MVINAFNSGADSYMTDFEDSNSPSWSNQIQGQINIGKAIRRTLTLEQKTAAGSKSYRLNEKVATLQVRPRGWHLDEKHVLIDGKRVHGGLFDFALFMFHNAKELVARGSGPYLLPAEDRELPRGAALERRLRDDAERARPAAGHDQGDGADRDDPRGVRDGRDPLRAARAQRRPERRALGLHLQLHQEVQVGPQLLPGRPRQGDDDGAVHAGLRAAAAADLPQARRAGDRRDERADPDQERPGQERGRDGRHHRRQAPRCDRRLRRRLGRPSGPGRGVDEGVRRGARRPAEPVREAARPTSRSARPTCSTSSRRSRSPRPACG